MRVLQTISGMSAKSGGPSTCTLDMMNGLQELGESRTFLSELLGKDVKEICLPVGCYNEHLLEQVQIYGYEKVYSSIPGDYSEKTRGGMIRRNLCQFSSPEEVKLILRGGNETVKRRYEKLHYVKEE